jgi:mannan polymerase II complex MNN10 subunit
VRSSLRSIEFLNEIRAVHDREKAQSGNLLGDQDSMQALLQSNSPLTQHVLRIPQWKINAFPKEIGCYDMHKREWEKGMFVVHFAGAWAHVSGEDPTGQLMKKYESQIV